MANDTHQEPQKRGPKPKQLEEFTKLGIPVGREGIHVDPDEVEQLAALGCSWREIADFFGIHQDTARRNFAANYIKGLAKASISLRRAMLHNATQNMNASVQIFLSKNWLGLSDDPRNTSDDTVLPWVEAEPKTEPVSGKIGIKSTLTLKL